MLPMFSNVPAQNSIIINSFKGINVTPGYKSGEFTKCLNIDLTSYPALSSRKKRTLGSVCEGKINGVGSFDGFFYTYYKEKTKSIFLSYKGKDYEFTSYTNHTDFSLKRRFATLEKAILIIPDNVIFFVDKLIFKNPNIYQYADYQTAGPKYLKESNGYKFYTFVSSTPIGDVAHNKISSKKLTYTPGSNTKYDFYPVAFDPSIEPGDVVTIKMYTNSSSATSSDAYNKLVWGFRSGITVKVKAVEKKKHNIVGSSEITEVVSLSFENNTINTGGYSDLTFSSIEIEKKLPNLTALTSYNNRVWGVCGNKVCTSKLGDADEWNDFSVDSYGTLPSSCFSATAGTDGDFTAIIPHGNYIYAFKENYIHKIYGDTPDEYTITNLKAPGCIKSGDTLSVCGTYLVYASNDGIYVLRDGYPKLISQKIGQINPVCAASHSSKYYLICQKEKGRVMYVYDLNTDIWTMQSCSNDADNLCSDARSLCFTEGSSLVYINTSEDVEEYEKNVHWNFTLRFDENDFSKNTSLRAIARISLSKNASFTVRALYDDDTRGAICGYSYDETQNGSCILRLPVKRDLGFYLEFKGVGGFTLRNIKFNYYKSIE